MLYYVYHSLWCHKDTNRLFTAENAEKKTKMEDGGEMTQISRIDTKTENQIHRKAAPRTKGTEDKKDAEKWKR